MLLFIWKGKGFIAFLIPLVVLCAVVWPWWYFFGHEKDYYAIFITGFIYCPLSYVVYKKYIENKVFYTKSGEIEKHSLFWIDLKYWVYYILPIYHFFIIAPQCVLEALKP